MTDLAWRLLTRKWGGLVAMDRLAALVRSEVKAEDILQSPVVSAFGAVELETGAVRYCPVDPGTEGNVLDFVVASTSEPITMPLVEIGGRHYYDGGIRDVAPLKQAIVLGATEIVCVACQPEQLDALDPSVNLGDPLALVGRVLDVVTNEILNGDLETLVEVNRLLREAEQVPALEGKREIPLLVVRPRERLSVEITRFGPADVAGMVAVGREEATKRLAEARLSAANPGHALVLDLPDRAIHPTDERVAP